MIRLTAEIAQAATEEAWAGFARGAEHAASHFAWNIRHHEPLSSKATAALREAIYDARRRTRGKKPSAGELIHHVAVQDRKVRCLGQAKRGPPHSVDGGLIKLADAAKLLKRFKPAEPRHAAWGAGPGDVTQRPAKPPSSAIAVWNIPHSSATARRTKPNRVPSGTYVARGKLTPLFFSHRGRGTNTLRGTLHRRCVELGLATHPVGTKMVEVSVLPRNARRFWKPTVFDSFSPRLVPAVTFPDWLARADSPCGRTRNMNTGHSSLPELIVELAPSVRVTVKDEGLLAKKVERKYLRRRAP